jgi:hypothetical protein
MQSLVGHIIYQMRCLLGDLQIKNLTPVFSLPNPVLITLQLHNYRRIMKIPHIHRTNEIKNIKILISANPFDRTLCKSDQILEHT